MKVTYFFLLLIIILNTSCTKELNFSGTIKMAADGNWNAKVYLIQPQSFESIASSYVGVVLDSATIAADGSFGFNKMPDAPEAILLQVAIQKKGEKFLNQLENEAVDVANYFPLVWQNGSSISISADAAHFQNSFAIKKPSPQNTAMLQLRDLRKEGFDKYFSKKNTNTHDENELLKGADALQKYQAPLMDFAAKSPDLLPALVAIRWVSIQSDYERIPEFIFAQGQKWQAKQPNHPWVIQLCEKASRASLPMMIGDELPSFSMPMLSGDTISLHQLFGKRLTILDLWASWCGPCRLENRNYLVPIWEKHHKNGLQIVGYALDASDNVWKSAIEKDGAARWVHASHLQGDESPLFKTLRIMTIPANFLVDGTGKVVAKNLHGEELVKFVDDFMK